MIAGQDGSRREVNLIPNAQIDDQLFNQLADKKVPRNYEWLTSDPNLQKMGNMGMWHISDFLTISYKPRCAWGEFFGAWWGVCGWRTFVIEVPQGSFSIFCWGKWYQKWPWHFGNREVDWRIVDDEVAAHDWMMIFIHRFFLEVWDEDQNSFKSGPQKFKPTSLATKKFWRSHALQERGIPYKTGFHSGRSEDKGPSFRIDDNLMS